MLDPPWSRSPLHKEHQSRLVYTHEQGPGAGGVTAEDGSCEAPSDVALNRQGRRLHRALPAASRHRERDQQAADQGAHQRQVENNRASGVATTERVGVEHQPRQIGLPAADVRRMSTAIAALPQAALITSRSQFSAFEQRAEVRWDYLVPLSRCCRVGLVAFSFREDTSRRVCGGVRGR